MDQNQKARLLYGLRKQEMGKRFDLKAQANDPPSPRIHSRVVNGA